jgi:hypothetical protein
MSIAAIFIIIIVLIVLVIVGIHLYNKQKGTNNGFVDSSPPSTTQSQQQSNLAYNSYLPVPAWGDFTPSTSGSGQCLNYTVSAAQFTPEFPSFNGLNSGAGRGYITTNQTCLDIDQIFAQAGSHICQYNNAGSAASGCILTIPTLVNGVMKYPGTVVPRGTVEGLTNSSGTGSYFVPCNYGNFTTTIVPSADNNSSACGGAIGLISPNFTPILNLEQPNSLCRQNGSTTNQCIALSDARTNNTAYDVELRECSLGDFEQIFRMTRYEIDDSFNLTQNDAGRFASIIYRENGFYLAPSMQQDVVSGAYLFDSLLKDVILSFETGLETIKLQLINPQNDPTRNGVYWFLQNQLTNPAFDPVTIPPQQYYGCNIYGVDQLSAIGKCSLTGVPSFYQPSYIPGGSATSYTGIAPISPQQIVYIPDQYQFPTATNDLSGLFSYLENQYSINMITDPNNNLLPILQKFRTGTVVTIEYETCDPAVTPNPTDVPNPTYPPGSPFIPNPGTCIKSYSAGNFPIQNTSAYTDTQFLSYLNIQNDMTTGISNISPGCLQQETNFISNIFNPIISDTPPLLTATPLSTQTS